MKFYLSDVKGDGDDRMQAAMVAAGIYFNELRRELTAAGVDLAISLAAQTPGVEFIGRVNLARDVIQSTCRLMFAICDEDGVDEWLDTPDGCSFKEQVLSLAKALARSASSMFARKVEYAGA